MVISSSTALNKLLKLLKMNYKVQATSSFGGPVGWTFLLINARQIYNTIIQYNNY